MQILELIQNGHHVWLFLGLGEIAHLEASVSLTFNPVKLIGLVVWFYLCLYIVQRLQFSSLAPKQFKPVVYIIGLFAGPILLLILLAVDVVIKASQGDENVFEIMKEQMRHFVSGIRSLRSKKQDSTIKLLDSSGRSIDEIYGHGDKKKQDSQTLDLTEQIIANALELRASDILIDPKSESIYTIRLRIDGVLRMVRELQTEICKAVVNSIKAVSSMDISEKRRPQDGAFLAKKGERTASFRVASAGVLSGEKLSIRVLNQDAGTFTLADVGLTKKQSSIIENAISKPSGMVLIGGPTGSGKTTTMYAMLNQIDRFTRNVITVEDPIEAVLREASQIEINPKADITFAKALRSILRQDPDVICVGEIRDEETAEIALRAAQTGHLVLATIHCDSNATALVRLIDLGISPLLLSSGLSLLMSQRLLRRLCDYCKRQAQLSKSQIYDFHKRKIDYTNIFEAVGCKRCNGTGYWGRIAVCDLLTVTDQLKEDIANKPDLVTVLRKDGEKRGRSNLRKQSLKCVVTGMTSLQEIKRVIG